MKNIKPKRKAIMSGIYLLPNLITTSALFCGINSIISSIKGEDLPRAAWFILFAVLFDFLDGYVARASNTCSSFGVEYDSLSDVIAFGVAPASLFYSTILVDLKKIGSGAAFIFIACAALRLARFNSKIEGTEKVAFNGLPTTAAAAFMATLYLLMHRYNLYSLDPVIPGLMVAISLLMVSSVKYPAISAVQIWKKKPFFYLGITIIMIGLIFFFKELCFFAITLAYLLVGLFNKLMAMRQASPASKTAVGRHPLTTPQAPPEDHDKKGE